MHTHTQLGRHYSYAAMHQQLAAVGLNEGSHSRPHGSIKKSKNCITRDCRETPKMPKMPRMPQAALPKYGLTVEAIVPAHLPGHKLRDI